MTQTQAPSNSTVENAAIVASALGALADRHPEFANAYMQAGTWGGTIGLSNNRYGSADEGAHRAALRRIMAVEREHGAEWARTQDEDGDVVFHADLPVVCGSVGIRLVLRASIARTRRGVR